MPTLRNTSKELDLVYSNVDSLSMQVQKQLNHPEKKIRI